MTPETTTTRAKARKDNEARHGEDPLPDEDPGKEKPEADHRFRDWALI
jgi:hypothetical protein